MKYLPGSCGRPPKTEECGWLDNPLRFMRMIIILSYIVRPIFPYRSILSYYSCSHAAYINTRTSFNPELQDMNGIPDLAILCF